MEKSIIDKEEKQKNKCETAKKIKTATSDKKCC